MAKLWENTLEIYFYSPNLMSWLKIGMSECRTAAHNGTETRKKSVVRASVSRNRSLFIFRNDYIDKNFTAAKYESVEEARRDSDSKLEPIKINTSSLFDIKNQNKKTGDSSLKSVRFQPAGLGRPIH